MSNTEVFLTADKIEQLRTRYSNTATIPIHECGMCSYQCGYKFTALGMVYDAGCHCTGSKEYRPADIEDLIGHFELNKSKAEEIFNKLMEN